MDQLSLPMPHRLTDSSSFFLLYYLFTSDNYDNNKILTETMKRIFLFTVQLTEMVPLFTDTQTQLIDTIIIIAVLLYVDALPNGLHNGMMYTEAQFHNEPF